ncbi:MAG: aminotransferase class I/II-fold pyridoxal phosphate-dependent enzyme [Planctomycetes bacterium]|nr:aminotransferase class I/II-fold pyridoxal phosphate-dependent enzyme [Planctomycetota bacterium]
MRILVTGGAGYLGSVLCRQLLEAGHTVRCFDSAYFSADSVADLRGHPRFEFVQGNLVELECFPDLLTDIDGICHLAGLANDPSCDLEPEMTELANYRATVELADRALGAGVRRFVFASSCSVYGAGTGLSLDESAELHPVSLYAQSKVRAERRLNEMVARGLEPVHLRQATLFGLSPRMRFDLAINVMTLHAVKKGRVFVLGGGEQWRPFLHVADSARAFVRCLEAPSSLVAGQVFNVGSDGENYQIRDLAKLVVDQVPGAHLEEAPGDADRRSYNVCFEKIHRVLEWSPEVTARDGAIEIRDALSRGEFSDFDSPRYYNIKTHQRNQETPVAEGGEPLRGSFLPFALPSIGEEEIAEVVEVLRSGWVTTGPRTRRFEEAIRDYTGAADVVAVNSCTAALHICLASMDIGPGDEVITTPVTWPSTANVIVHTGATPVFVDIERDSFNIDPERIEEKITDKTKAIIPVHMAGQPVDLDAIHEIADRRGLTVIEDAAHAIGAEYRGRRIGSISRFACFSFYPIKNITTGEGGAIAFTDPADGERLRRLALHGITKDAWNRYTAEGSIHWECIEPGFKYNLPDLCAALGVHQMPRLDGFIETRRRYARLYRQALLDCPEVIVPNVSDDIRHAHHLFIIMLRTEMLKLDRDAFVQALKKENIGTGIHFRSLHLQPYYRDRFGFTPDDFPNASFTSERIISLPLYPGMAEKDVLQVANSVKKLVKYYRR